MGERGPGAAAELPFSSQKLPQSQLSKKDNFLCKKRGDVMKNIVKNMIFKKKYIFNKQNNIISGKDIKFDIQFGKLLL